MGGVPPQSKKILSAEVVITNTRTIRTDSLPAELRGTGYQLTVMLPLPQNLVSLVCRSRRTRHGSRRSRPRHMFSDEEGGLIFCAVDSAETRDEKGVYKAFRDQFGDECQKLSGQAKVLFKVTVEDGSKQKPLVYVGVAHTAKFSEVLALFDAKYCKVAGQQGAFLLKAGYGINPNKSAGNVFMHYGLDLTFHTKVDFTRVAYAR